MNNKKSTYIFDVNSHFSRVYFAITRTGIPNGPEDFYNGKPIFVLDSLLKMIYKEIRLAKTYGYSYNHIALVFDHPGENFRHEIFPQYKANRPPRDKEYTIQLELAYQMFQTQGFPCLRVKGYESDDVIGTLAKKLSKHDKHSIIFGKDKDTLQLIDSNTLQFNAAADTLFDESKVLAKFGVPPNKISDYLAMVGDSADGLSGIVGVGPKTASKILENMTLAEFVKDPKKLEDSGIRGIKSVIKTVEADRDTPKLMQKLTKLKTDVALGISLQQLTKGEAIVSDYLDTIT